VASVVVVEEPVFGSGELLQVVIPLVLEDVDGVVVVLEPATELKDVAFVVVLGHVVFKLVFVTLFESSDALFGSDHLFGVQSANADVLLIDFAAESVWLLDILVNLLGLFLLLWFLFFLFLFLGLTFFTFFWSVFFFRVFLSLLLSLLLDFLFTLFLGFLTILLLFIIVELLGLLLLLLCILLLLALLLLDLFLVSFGDLD